ncbi:unnamed protein product [Gongylonema pulchrum]|uniref:acid phosphatase n=1 Tax=Gongylonema pulchrum TaxID=637853 RepID=A0A183D3M6_9BILA|nr:unnamed protein product [Gongylonema pulchrum]
MRTIDIIKEFKRVGRISEYDTQEKARLKGGLLLGDMLDRFRNISVGTSTAVRKMHLYSAHDATITALLYALNLGDGLLVPYAACLFMELYRAGNDEAVVKTDRKAEISSEETVEFMETQKFLQIFYKNETESVHELSVPECTEPCTLDQLINLTEKTTVHTLKELNQVTHRLISATYQ